VVIAGGHVGDDAVARWAYAVRLAAGAMPVAVYRRGPQRVRMRATGTSVLPSGASEAQRSLLELVEADQGGRTTRVTLESPYGIQTGSRTASM